MPPKVPTNQTKTNTRRLALVICNGSFPEVPNYLLGPAKDAVLLDATLSDPETCRFAVRCLVDQGLLAVRREIARICADASEEDTLLIYYSGNGFLGEGSLYLMVSDSDRELLHATALDAEFVLAQLRRSSCRKIILLIDCCHAGAFFNNNRGIPDGLYAITSCGAEEICRDTPEGGVFTLALVAGLRGAAADRDGDGKVSIDELHEFIKEHLRSIEAPQMPQKWVWNVPEPIAIANVPRHVFLSYAREDKAAIERLAEALKAEGLSVWIDLEGIRSGNWQKRVTEGLNFARALVVLLTKHSLASDAVKNEIGFAARRGVPILPIQTKDLQENDLPDWYALEFIDLHRHTINMRRYLEGVRALAAAIRTSRRSKIQGVRTGA